MYLLWFGTNKILSTSWKEYEYRKKYHQRYRQKHRIAYNAYHTDYQNNLRKRLVTELGNKCGNLKCLVPGGCTDIRCLQLDHINGGGTKELKKGPVAAYKYYLKHLDIARQHLQVLCANCNWIKRHEKNENRKLL